MRKVYFDHGATTPVFPQVIDAMSDLMKNHFGNPSSLHSFGVDAKNYLDKARAQVASALGARPEEVFFTSGGTEADNLAILGTAERLGKGHIITTPVEHHAVLDTCQYLAKNGFDLTILPVDEYGMIDVDDLKKALRPDTILVSMIHGNNEIGSINPVKEVGELLAGTKTLFHIDCVQSFGKIPFTAEEVHADFISVSSHKINGPKGVGALYKRQGTALNRRVFGGGQEKRLRSGTENMPGIVGFGLACELTMQNLEEHSAQLCAMRDRLISRVLDEIPHSRLNGHPSIRLPQNVNLSFNFIEGEALLLYLDINGIACSTGSACSSSSMQASHVLTAIGLAPEWSHSAVRMTLGYGNSTEDVDYTVDVLKDRVQLLRLSSPYYDPKTGGASGLKVI